MFDSCILNMMYDEFMKNFFLADSRELVAVRLNLSPEPKKVYSFFLDMIYVEFMKNCFLADSRELVAVRLSGC